MEDIFYIVAGVILGGMVSTTYSWYENSKLKTVEKEITQLQRVTYDLLQKIEKMEKLAILQSELNDKQVALNAYIHDILSKQTTLNTHFHDNKQN